MYDTNKTYSEAMEELDTLLREDKDYEKKYKAVMEDLSMRAKAHDNVERYHRREDNLKAFQTLVYRLDEATHQEPYNHFGDVIKGDKDGFARYFAILTFIMDAFDIGRYMAEEDADEDCEFGDFGILFDHFKNVLSENLFVETDGEGIDYEKDADELLIPNFPKQPALEKLSDYYTRVAFAKMESEQSGREVSPDDINLRKIDVTDMFKNPEKAKEFSENDEDDK